MVHFPRYLTTEFSNVELYVGICYVLQKFRTLNEELIII